jgi:hypothetical protein
LIAFGLVPSIVVGAPLLSASCTGGNGADSGIDASGPCQNGTIRLLDCEPNEAGVASELFTDEACDGLDTAEMRNGVMHSDMQAPGVDMPTEGQVLPSATPFTFVWHNNGLTLRAPAAPATRAFTWRDDLVRWTTFLPSAAAHCAPFGGIGYAITFIASNNQLIFRVETANRRYTPTADDWTRLRAAIGTITMNVEAARFFNNAVTEGPFDEQTPRHFTIGP